MEEIILELPTSFGGIKWRRRWASVAWKRRSAASLQFAAAAIARRLASESPTPRSCTVHASVSVQAAAAERCGPRSVSAPGSGTGNATTGPAARQHSAYAPGGATTVLPRLYRT